MSRGAAGGVDTNDTAAVVWAKSWPRYGSEIESWLPLWQHLDDTMDVAGLLFDEWLAPSIIRVLADAMPAGEPDARRLLLWMAGVHDIGKATPAFAVDVGVLANSMTRSGLRIGPMAWEDRHRLRHDVAGAAALERWLAGRGMGRHARRQLSGIVAGHHGSYPSYPAVQDGPAREYLFGDTPWVAVQDALLDRAAQRAQVEDRLADWARVALPQVALLSLTGVVVMADWIASGDAFPLLPIGDAPDMPEPTPGPSARARRAWARVGIDRGWQPLPPRGDVVRRFGERFPWAATTGPRPLQVRVTEAAERMAAPGLMIVEAPMGGGKTEAAFMAAEVLAARCGASGCFVALPTQATSNAMFTRALDWLENLPDDRGVGALSVALVHGKAALNEDLRRLPPLGSSMTNLYDEDPVSDGHLRAALSEWMRGRKRAALASFVVGTIDQVLFAALKARHVMLRQLALAGKVVIIDEVHAADVFMSAFLDLALEWLAAAGVPVVLMSATLPAERRTALYAAYERGRRIRLGLDGDPGADEMLTGRLAGDIGYPSIVTTGPAGPQVEIVQLPAEVNEVDLVRLDDSPEALAALLEAELADGGCAVVIRNTVRRAQETAAQLAGVLGDETVTLAHAQFLAADRIANDNRLIRRFGPPGVGDERPTRHVVVATQVVEQSLDLDFDLMVTDVAPVDLVLQRIGRLHRHRRGRSESERPPRLRRARCYLAGVDWAETPPGLEGGAKAVYKAWPLLRSLVVLGEHLAGRPLQLPHDIASLVQAAYAAETEVPKEWHDAVEAAWVAYREEQDARRHSAGTFALPPVGRNGSDLYGLSRLGAGDVDEDSRQGQACVRDGGDSIEVVVVQCGADGMDRVPDWVAPGQMLPYRHLELSGEQARLLARCALRLPAALSRGKTGDAVIAELERNRFEGWHRTAYLSGQLALVLDDDRKARVAGYDLEYDLRRGLVFRKADGGDVSGR